MGLIRRRRSRKLLYGPPPVRYNEPPSPKPEDTGPWLDSEQPQDEEAPTLFPPSSVDSEGSQTPSEAARWKRRLEKVLFECPEGVGLTDMRDKLLLVYEGAHKEGETDG